jgi:hypothetical protein
MAAASESRCRCLGPSQGRERSNQVTHSACVNRRLAGSVSSTALFRSRVYLRVLHPGLTEVHALLRPADAMPRPAFATLATTMDQILNTILCAA